MQSDNNEGNPHIVTISNSIQNFNVIVNSMIERSLDEMYMEIAINQSLNESINERKDSIKIKTGCIKFSEVKDEDKPQCMVCLLQFKNEDDVQYLSCSHLFHHKCVNEWVKYKPECPTCRQQIDTETTISETDEAISMRAPLDITVECDQCGESFNEEDFIEHECQVSETKEESDHET